MRKRRNRLLFLLDANACNARQQIAELNELERIGRSGLIDLEYTETTWDEARRNSERRQAKVDRRLFVGLNGDTELEAPWRESIARVVFPEGVLADDQRRDVEALLTAKLAGAFFVTRDGASKTQPGGILGHKVELAALGIEVLTFQEAVQRARTAA
ncbi:MAG: hypothetical protein RKO68_10155 [Candidatus Accumulibacter sp.]|nr:hypothetical protein [Accumulibacter sp.]